MSNIITKNNPLQTVFYTIEHSIKEFRKFAQSNISNCIDDITIDQSLVLMILDEHPDLSQKEISELLFKDFASMTRMI